MGAVVVVLVVGIGAWQYAARAVRVEADGVTLHSGMSMPDCLPDMALAMYTGDDALVVGQAVRNPSPWPVTVISQDPESYRFEALSDDPADDNGVTGAEGGGAPAGTADRIVLPPGRGVTMWIVDPQHGAIEGSDIWYGFDEVPVTLRVLGVESESALELPGTIYIGGRSDGDRLGEALQEACDA
ncbi:hypothetical protein [Promicromonospora sukumoe]